MGQKAMIFASLVLIFVTIGAILGHLFTRARQSAPTPVGVPVISIVNAEKVRNGYQAKVSVSNPNHAPYWIDWDDGTPKEGPFWDSLRIHYKELPSGIWNITINCRTDLGVPEWKPIEKCVTLEEEAKESFR